MGQSKTSKYYANNPEAAEKRREYQRKYNKKPSKLKHRMECNKARRELGLKKGDQRDASHNKDGTITAENRKTNRARNGADGKSTKR